MLVPKEYRIFILSKGGFVQEVLEQIYPEDVILTLSSEKELIAKINPNQQNLLINESVYLSEFMYYFLPTVILGCEQKKVDCSVLSIPFQYSDLKKKIDTVKENMNNFGLYLLELNKFAYLNSLKRKLLVKKGEELKFFDLTAKEAKLLSFIADKPGKVAKKGEILEKVFGYNDEANTHTVETHISRIRNKDESLKDLFFLSSNKYGFQDT